MRADLRNGGRPHQEDQSAVQPRQRVVILRGDAALLGVGGDDMQRVGEAAVRDGDTGAFRRGDGRSDAGHDFVGDAVRQQRFDFLAAAAEQKRVAALEAHDVASVQRFAHDQGFDLALRHGVTAAFLAHVDAARGAGHQRQHAVADEAVEDHDFGAFQNFASAAGEQTGIARTGADEPDLTDGHEITSPP